MDTLIFEASVTNVSGAPVLFPVSTGSEVLCPQRDLMVAEFELFVEGERGSFVGSFALSGSRAVAGTMKQLHPGESVTVRVPTFLQYAPSRLLPAPGRPVEWRLGVGFEVPSNYNGGLGNFGTVRSENSIPVQIAAPLPAVAPRAPSNELPEILAVSPTAAAAGTVVRVDGRGFGDADNRPTATLSSDAVTLPAKVGGYGYASNAPEYQMDYAALMLPATLSPGEWLLRIDVSGRTSAPIPLSIVEPAPARLERLYPERAYPGGGVDVWGSQFAGESDVIELTDASGRLTTSASTTHGDSIGLSVPFDAAEGKATIRVLRDALVSNALSLMIVRRPLPPVLAPPDVMRPVAPGQWIDSAISSESPLVPPDRVDIEFQQGTKRIEAIAILKEAGARVEVPRGLHGGAVTLRARAWRFGGPSEWSSPIAYEVASKPAEANVSTIGVGPAAQFVGLWPGPLRPVSFQASPGDELLLSGDFPVGDLNALRISVEGPSGRRRLKSDKNGDYTVRAYLPRELPTGRWALVIEGPRMAKTRVPIPMDIAPW